MSIAKNLQQKNEKKKKKRKQQVVDFKNQKIADIINIPLNDLPCVSCTLFLLCHLTPRNQDHVPKVDKFLLPIPSKIKNELFYSTDSIQLHFTNNK